MKPSPGHRLLIVVACLLTAITDLSGQELIGSVYVCTGDVTSSVAMGDLDGDGDPDLVFGNGRHTPEHNLIYFNDGSGRLSGGTPFGGGYGSEAPRDRTYRVALADLDSDGDLDMVSGNDAGDPNVVLLNDGLGRFVMGGAFGIVRGGRDEATRELALGDLDNDGDIDIAVANRGNPNLVALNDGNAGFRERRVLSEDPDQSVGIAIGDLDGDGDEDIVVGNRRGHPVYVYWNEGSATFSERLSVGAATDQTVDVALVDLDGDGAREIVASNEGTPNYVYWNSEDGPFSRSSAFGSGEDAPRVVVPSDFDGDGDLDLVVGHEARQYRLGAMEPGTEPVFFESLRAERNQVFWNDGTGILTPGIVFGQPGARTRDLVVVDLDGDGGLDIVEANSCGENGIHFFQPIG